MKLLGVLWLLVFLGTSLVAPGHSVAAQTSVRKDQITVTGVVLPAQHVVVDGQGTIIEIISNTTEDIEPTVYLRSLAKQNIRPVTPEIHEQFRRIVPLGHSRVGILYKHAPGTYAFTSPGSILEPKSAPYMIPFSDPSAR